MNTPLWSPTAESIAAAQITQFQARYCPDATNYAELHHWSVENLELFWRAIWEFCQIQFSSPFESALTRPNKMRAARWFEGARFNFAENLLTFSDDKPALIFCDELGKKRSLSYPELRQQVETLAKCLADCGIEAGDRIAAVMPNCPEAIIAMLATTSLGAVWSSCSPDFGLQAIVDRFEQIEPKALFATDGHIYNGKSHSSLEKLTLINKRIPCIHNIIIAPFLEKKPRIGSVEHGVLLDDFTSNVPSDDFTFYQGEFDHPLYILFSSGTTGKPKCIVHGAGGTLLQHKKEHMLHCDLRSNDTLFYFTTCGWMMWNWMTSALSVGATLILYDGSPFHPKPDVLIDLIDTCNITVFGTSAKYLSSLEKAGIKPKQSHQLTHLRMIASTGSPLVPEQFDYVYENFKEDICLASISGGTDIVSCFALGNTTLPVYRGELQCIGLGLDVHVFNDKGMAVTEEKGELVCTSPFPCRPIYFWNDHNHEKYDKAYFAHFPGVWAHGDFAEITQTQGLIIFGRADATLNPGGVRIGTAEIYAQVDKINEVLESLAIDQLWEQDTRIVLFVKLRPGFILDDAIRSQIRTILRSNASPRHVPAKILQVPDLPRTMSGKIVELAVRNIVHGQVVTNVEALANPEALDYFKNRPELQTG